MDKEEVYIIIFKSSSYTTRIYKLLKDKGYDIRIIATPCVISSGCSRAIKVRKKFANNVIEEVKKNNIPIVAVYVRKIINRKFEYTEVKD